MDNTVKAARVITSPCLKYFNSVTGNFPGLRAALRSVGFEPTFIHVNKCSFDGSLETIVLYVELSHDKLPEYYKNFMNSHDNVRRIYLVARTQVRYAPHRYLSFLIAEQTSAYLPPRKCSLHLNLLNSEWTWGGGKWPFRMSDI